MPTPSFYLNFNAESCAPYHNDDVANDRPELISGDGKIGDTVWKLNGHNATVTESRETFDGTGVTRLTTILRNDGDTPLLVDCLSSAFVTGIGAEGGAWHDNRFVIHYCHSVWQGEGQWRFMLQVSTDDRVRFIDAKFSSGKFISGNLCVFGLKSAKLNAEDFALLKRDFVMAASKIGSKPSSPVVIHRSRKNRLKRTASWKEVRNFRLNPIGDLWGGFPSVIKQRGVKVDSLACTVDYESGDGVKGSLGKFVNGKKGSSFSEGALYKAIVKIHADAGADTSKINMRKAIDLYIGARLKYTPVD